MEGRENQPNIEEKFLKPYDATATEPRLYAEWEQSGYFNPDQLPATEHAPAGPLRKPFTIMMPPPNATGVLHMGHALGLTIQDIVTRFERMRGKAALWLPGTDHAAIATQSVVEKEISKKEGKSRHDLGREELLRRIGEFVEQSRDTIRSQIRVMGASADWSREAFTFDAARNRAVNTLFKMMYDAGLIYRGHRIVNWDPKGQTTISDDEIVHEERAGKLYTFRYSKDFPIPIATTRPETKLGDTAVAVSPNDPRYAEYVGKTFDLEFMGEKLSLQVIADESVDPAFGTGALGVTPAHSLVDWEMKDRHGLKVVHVIDERGRMLLGDESVKGKKIAEARETIVQWLRDQGLLEKEEDVTQSIATAERTGGMIEPQIKLQWFVDVDKPFTVPGDGIPGIAVGSKASLKELMRAAVANGGVKIIPDHLEKTYFHWIDNLRPWCISRQIWYGHRIPVWYRGEEIAVGEAPAGDWNAEGWKQDEDTLDTWFSSGAWTFTTLGWPDETPDLARFHPTDLLETGHDILFFWIARMILMTGFALGQVPFRTAYLHGLVRDAKGQKFSKSLGNGIDPIVIVQKYGADAARMALIVGNTPGTDLKLSEDRIKGYKHFANKLWNIARFILENAQVGNDSSSLGEESSNARREAALSAEDQVLQEEFSALAQDVTKDMAEYRMYMAAEKLYHYAWHRFADEMLEQSKPIFRSEDAAAIASRQAVLLEILDGLMRLLHPFMPFVTEEIWRSLPGNAGAVLMVADWPVMPAVE